MVSPLQAIFSVICDGDNPEKIEEAISNEVKINKRSPDYGKTLLFKSAKYGRYQTLCFLINAKANLEIPSSTHNNTPLHAAARKGHLLCVKSLLHAKANIAAQTNTGETALHLAIEEGHNVIAATLIENGAPLKQTNNEGLTPFHIAKSTNNKPLLGLLCEYLLDEVKDQMRDTFTTVDKSCEIALEALSHLKESYRREGNRPFTDIVDEEIENALQLSNFIAANMEALKQNESSPESIESSAIPAEDSESKESDKLGESITSPGELGDAVETGDVPKDRELRGESTEGTFSSPSVSDLSTSEEIAVESSKM